MAKVYRQVVADKSITSSKSFNDFLYAWIVLHSEEENGERYIWKRTFVLSQLESELATTRKTLAKQFDYLIEGGLLYDDGERWKLTGLGNRDGFGVQEEILERLIQAHMKYLISIYVYLAMGVEMRKRTGFWTGKAPVVLNGVKEFIGLSVGSRSNSKTVVDCFETLREMGLLKYSLTRNNQGHTFYLLEGIGELNYF